MEHFIIIYSLNLMIFLVNRFIHHKSNFPNKSNKSRGGNNYLEVTSRFCAAQGLYFRTPVPRVLNCSGSATVSSLLQRQDRLWGEWVGPLGMTQGYSTIFKYALLHILWIPVSYF